MDDSSTADVNESNCRILLGMGSFGPQEREHFGQNTRVAFECIEGSSEPVEGMALPLDKASNRQRLKVLSQKSPPIQSRQALLVQSAPDYSRCRSRQ